jgi:hypothetical protein
LPSRNVLEGALRGVRLLGEILLLELLAPALDLGVVENLAEDATK